MQWRSHTRPTDVENAFAKAFLERERSRLERGKPLTITLGGFEFGRRLYIHKRAGELSKVAWNCITLAALESFLKRHREVARRRIRWGLYYNVTQFEKSWQKSLRGVSRTKKVRLTD